MISLRSTAFLGVLAASASAPALAGVVCTFAASGGTLLENYVGPAGEAAFAKNASYPSLSAGITAAHRAHALNSSVGLYYISNVPATVENSALEARFYVASVPALGTQYFIGPGVQTATSGYSGYYAVWTPNFDGAWQILLYGGRPGSVNTLGTFPTGTPTTGTTHTLKVYTVDGQVRVDWDGANVIAVTPSVGAAVNAAGVPGLYFQGVDGYNGDDQGIQIEHLAYTYTVGTAVSFAPTDLTGNDRDGTGNPPQSCCAALVLNTNAARLRLKATSTIYPYFPAVSQIGLRINGAAQSPIISTDFGQQTFTRDLPVGSKRVEIIVGSQGLRTLATSDATVYGTFLDSVEVLDGTASIVAPTSANRLVVYGDSISAGADATNPTTEGYGVLLRTQYGRNVTLEAWSYRALHDDCADATARTAFVARLTAIAPAKLYIAIGTNDFGFQYWSAADFGAAYADLLDKLHAVMPALPIYCQSPLQRIAPSSEAANSQGSTLGDYRAQIATAAGARSGYCTNVNGAAGALVPDSGIDSGGVHPTTAGHATLAGAINTILG